MTETERMQVYLEMSKNAVKDMLWSPYDFDPRREPDPAEVLNCWNARFNEMVKRFKA